MKLLSFLRAGKPGYGVVVDGGVFDLTSRLGKHYPTLRQALHPDAVAEIRLLLPKAAADFPLEGLEFPPVILDGNKILAIGRNYGKHAKEGGREVTEKPMLFARYPSSHVGHEQAMVRPFVSEQFDYEGELAVVIGRPGRHIPVEKWREHVAGYTCFNDGSIRDWQFHTTQLIGGKTFWHSGAIGPWIVTADELPDPDNFTLMTRVNGVELQNASVSDLIFKIPVLINYISTIIDLEPGDIIATGTPEGVGLFRKPPLFLKAGDTVEVEISGIGVLRNPVVDETRPG